jgi:hypothetical protein
LLARGGDTKYETLDGFSALDLCSTLEYQTQLLQATKAQQSPGQPLRSLKFLAIVTPRPPQRQVVHRNDKRTKP